LSFPYLDSTVVPPVTMSDHRVGDGINVYRHDGGSQKVTGETAMLQSLFDRTGGGLHSTLQHEAIMNASLPEYSILERDASRIAQHAIHTLRLSTARRLKEAIDVPTWTGKSGAAGAPSTRRPVIDSSRSSGTGSTSTWSSRDERFGTKSNPLFRSAITTPTDSSPSSSSDVLHHRTDLSILSSPQSSIPPPSSRSILSHLRGDKPSSSCDTDELPHTDNHPLIHQIQQFLSSRGGQGTTHDVINHFHLRLSQQQLPLFRKLLRSIAEFHRDQDFVGVWRLKSEFA
jgi:DNA excision repair protein ERCC-6